MGCGAGPGVVLGLYDHGSADGIQLDVADCVQKVVRIEWRRTITSLPEVAIEPSHPVDALRVLAVHRPQDTMHSIGTRRNDDEVHMVRHQAIRENLYTLLP